jgi:NhaA family Na+:H+ antiporter
VTVVNVTGDPAAQSLAQTLSSPVTLGVAIGLLVGKPIGVVGGAYLMARFTRAALNPALRWADIIAIGFLAGIGFTVSLLIAELAFDSDPLLLTDAKVGILTASFGAALLSTVALARRRRTLGALAEAEERDGDNDGIPDVYQQGPQATQQ